MSEADVVLNRINVALARSQRIINSWLPQKSQVEEENVEEDEDFKPMTEEGGIGSHTEYGDDESKDRVIQRRRIAADDKLLEQLLGKKAAHAKRKSTQSGKSMSAAKHAAPKSIPSRSKQKNDSESADEEDAGRSAAFTSRNPAKRKKYDHVEASSSVNGEYDSAITGLVELDALQHTSMEADTEMNAKPSSRKSTSYLDELLSHKSKKHKKKQKQRRAA